MNTAVYDGGAIYCDWTSIFIIDSTFSHNEVTKNDGGGKYAYTTNIHLLNSTFDHNIVNGYGSGGGFYNPLYFECPIPICIGMYCSTFIDNNATVRGSGMHVSIYGEESTYGQSCFKVLNLTFDNNYARKGIKNVKHKQW